MNNSEVYERFMYSLLEHLNYSRKLKKFIELGYVRYIQMDNEIKYINTLIDYYFKFGKSPGVDDVSELLIDQPHVVEVVRRHPVGVAFDVNFDFVCETIKDLYIKREIQSLKHVESLNDIIAIADKLYRETSVCRTEKTMIYDDVDIKIQEAKARRDLKPLETGSLHLDTILDGGFRKGMYYLFSGATGTGKTRWIMSIVHGMIKNKASGVFVSLEMARYIIEALFISKEKQIDVNDFQNGRMSDDELHDIYCDIAVMKDNLSILRHNDTSKPMTVQMLESEIEKQMQINPFDFIVIDYITLMHMDGFPKEKSHMMYGKISELLKQIAEKHNICVISLAQSKAGRRGEEGFMSSDIGASYQMTHNADAVAGILKSKDGEMEIDFSKNRFGPLDKIKGYMVWQYNTWKEKSVSENYGKKETKENEHPF